MSEFSRTIFAAVEAGQRGAPLTMQESHDDFSASAYFAGQCLSAEIDAGRKLTPAEMLEAVGPHISRRVR